MKRNIVHMVGALVSSAILMLSCSEDNVPSYNELTVDKSDLFIKIEKPIAEVNITEGNGNYKIEVADENIATAQIDGNKIVFTALKNGRTTVKITDWAKHSAVISVRVKEDFELTLNKQELTLIKDANPTELIYITSGNGEYQVESLMPEIATVKLTEDGKVEVTAISEGFADIKVTDADGKTSTIKVLAAEYTFKLGDIPAGTWGMRESKSIPIKSGNGEYTTASNHDEIATAEVIDNALKITGHSEGEAIITITDKMGFIQTVTVNVEFKLITTTDIDEIIVNETTEIALLSGGSDFTIEITDGSTSFSKNPKIECSISNDNTKLLIKGISRGFSQTIKITDNEVGKSAEINVKIVDVPFYTKSKRYFVNAWFADNPAIGNMSTEDSKERVIMANKKGGWISPNTPVSGWIISFTGGRGADENPKGSPVLGHIDDSGKEDFYVPISNLRILKAEDGWYWIKFREKDNEFDSYMVVNP